jgi:hypothetical protein
LGVNQDGVHLGLGVVIDDQNQDVQVLPVSLFLVPEILAELLVLCLP